MKSILKPFVGLVDKSADINNYNTLENAILLVLQAIIVVIIYFSVMMDLQLQFISCVMTANDII